MAVTTAHGIDLPQAYIRIDEQSGGKENVTLRVRTYVNAEKCIEGKAWIEEKLHSFTPSVEDSAENFIRQGYEHLKTLEEFTEAVDA